MASDTMSTRNVWPNYSKNNVQLTSKTKGDSLGKDEFLKILVAQMRNQDPMQPMQDRDFIAQMAQFSSVEQLMNMSNEMTKLRLNLGTASAMIGKEVAWYDYSETGELIGLSGKVDSVLIKDGKQYARIGQYDIPFDNLVAIADEGGIPHEDDTDNDQQPPQQEEKLGDQAEELTEK